MILHSLIDVVSNSIIETQATIIVLIENRAGIWIMILLTLGTDIRETRQRTVILESNPKFV